MVLYQWLIVPLVEDIWQYRETFLVVITGLGVVLLESSG